VADEFKFLLADGELAVAEPNQSIELPPWFDWDKFRRYVRNNSWPSTNTAINDNKYIESFPCQVSVPYFVISSLLVKISISEEGKNISFTHSQIEA
jgi:hypothetical protein